MTRNELIETMARAIKTSVKHGADLWDSTAEADKVFIRKHATAALTALEAAGFVVVPKQASTEMVIAGQETFLDNGYTHGELHDGTLRKAYAAMIAAAKSQ